MAFDTDEVARIDPFDFFGSLREEGHASGQDVGGAILEEPVGREFDPHHAPIKSRLEAG